MRRNKRGGLIGLIVKFFLLIGSLFQHSGRLGTIIAKNFKVLLRSKSSALIIIFGPLLIIFLVGIAFSSNTVHDVNIGVFSDSYSELSDGLIKDLQDENYLIKKVDTRDECLEGVKDGELNICLVFSPEMSVGGESNQITFYVDYTRVNLVYAIMDDIGTKLSESTNELSLEMTQMLLDELENAKSIIAGKVSVLNAVSTNTRTMAEKIGNVKDDIKTFNLTKDAKDLRYNTVLDDFEDLILYLEDNNVSTGRTDTLNRSLDDFKENLDGYLYQVRQAGDSVDIASEMVTDFHPTLLTNRQKIDQVSGALEGVSQGIENIAVKEGGDIVSPIKTSVQPIVTEDTHMSKMFPTFLVLVIMFVCIMLGSTLVLNEKNTNASFRNFITPTSDSVFVFGTYLSSLLMVAIQLVVIFLVALFFLSSEMLLNLLPSLVPLFIISTLFIFLGMCIGYLFNSTETSTLASLFVISGSMLFSNTILPIENVPVYLQKVIGYNPFVLGESVLKKVILFDFGLGGVLSEMGILLILALVFVVLSYIFMKTYKRRVRR